LGWIKPDAGTHIDEIGLTTDISKGLFW